MYFCTKYFDNMIDINDKRFKDVLGENTPSEVQIQLCDFICHGIGNATVESRAGSGKSKTIELLVNFVPKNKKVLVVCFNKHIAENLQKRFNGKDIDVSVMTYHSLGNKILSYKKHINVKNNFNDNKYRNYIVTHVNELNPDYVTFTSGKKTDYKRNLEKLINYARYNLMQSKKEILKIANKYGVNLVSNECEAVSKILKWGCEHIEEYDYQDMIWLPYELNIGANIIPLQFDYIFIDEGQDSSLAQQNLINICTKRNTRFVVFGDSFQTINSWAGSDEEAFLNFNKKPNVKKFTLNTSYRCAKKIAELAKQFVEDFTTPEWAIEGEVNYDVSINDIREGDMVLCRLTAPLVDLHLRLINENKPSKIRGIELGKELIDIVNNCSSNNVTDIHSEIEKNLIDRWIEISEKNEMSLKDAASENDIMLGYDVILTLNIISKGIITKSELINRINELLIKNTENNEESINNIHLTTVHKAKGLENDRVFILCPSLMPSRLAHKEWEIKAERNLIYVAYTRAKKSLNFISEKEFPPSLSYSGIDNMYDVLLKIKNRIYGE